MAIIEVEHLTKEYRLGALTSFKDTLRHGVARLTGREELAWERDRFKALDNVSFTIEEGEVVGIIGHNGAGKSTLLKHLAQISRPTSGKAVVRGTVAPLIEVGAGLNPELTGRENIYLNGAILGIPKKEIDRKLDEIIEFSELEQFIDTPVKRYSSGMTVKLGFSIATSIDADILIVDEVLAVGDLAYQRKCFDRMEQMIRKQGKTVLLVSHNLRQVERLCERALCLSSGKIVKTGSAKDVCNYFYEENDRKIARQIAARGRWESSEEIELVSCVMENDAGEQISTIEHDDDALFTLTLNCRAKVENLSVVFGLHTTDFVFIGSVVSDPEDIPDVLGPGTYRLRVKLDNLPLSVGSYSVRVSFDIGKPVRNAFYADNVMSFNVIHKNVKKGDIANEGIILLNGDFCFLGNRQESGHVDSLPESV